MLQLNQGQQDAIASVCSFLLDPREREMVIKGRAGTGKSTLVQALVPQIKAVIKTVSILLRSSTESELHLCATTNKAAKVLADITKEDTSTIHVLLGLTIKNDYKNGGTKLIRRGDAKVIEDSIIIIDEAFYIDNVLADYIKKTTKNCKIIYIGDPYQCAPVMQTHSPVEDIQCREFELTQVMRNKGAIGVLAEHWRNTVVTGVFSPIVVNDPAIVYADGKEFRNQIDLHFGQQGIVDTTNKIVCWTNDKSTTYSEYVRELLGKPTEFTDGEYLLINNSLAKQGYPTDSVIQIKEFEYADTYFGVNGRWAKLMDGNRLFIPNSNQEYKQQLKHLASIKSWSVYYELVEKIPDLRPVHSCTIHKAQGSTYETVFIDLNDIGRCNIASDVARMMYVATSRPTSKIVFRGGLPSKYGG